MLPIIILSRVLFATCMVFIIGYVFGSFSKKPVLTSITKVATILAIVLFIATSVFSFRGGGWRGVADGKYHCSFYQKDSTATHQQQVR